MKDSITPETKSALRQWGAYIGCNYAITGFLFGLSTVVAMNGSYGNKVWIMIGGALGGAYMSLRATRQFYQNLSAIPTSK